MISADVKKATKTIEKACHGFTFDDVFPGDVETEPLAGDAFRLTIFGQRKVREFTVTITANE